MNEVKYYTVDEVAAMLQTTPSTIARAIRAGRLQAVKIGQTYRVTQDWIDAFIKAQTKVTK